VGVKKGFTIIELFVIVLIFGTAVVFFWVQKNRVDAAARDSHRKIAINAIYHNLEHYHDLHGYYPEMAEMADWEERLRAMDPQLFTDPFGFFIGMPEGMSDYRYEPTGCDKEGRCRSFTLRSRLEREADFIRGSRR